MDEFWRVYSVEFGGEVEGSGRRDCGLGVRET